MSADLFRYLDRVQGAYPYGVPKYLIEAAVKQTTSATSNYKVMVVVTAPSKQLEQADQDLLQSILSKGLQMDPAQVLVEVLDLSESSTEVIGGNLEDRISTLINETQKGSSISGEVTSNTKERSRLICLVLGAPRETTGVVHSNTDDCIWRISSHSLAEVRSDATKKRQLWNHLKQLKAQIVFPVS